MQHLKRTLGLSVLDGDVTCIFQSVKSPKEPRVASCASIQMLQIPQAASNVAYHLRPLASMAPFVAFLEKSTSWSSGWPRTQQNSWVWVGNSHVNSSAQAKNVDSCIEMNECQQQRPMPLHVFVCSVNTALTW